jgi:hypothetical protein
MAIDYLIINQGGHPVYHDESNPTAYDAATQVSDPIALRARCAHRQLLARARASCGCDLATAVASCRSTPLACR